MCRYTINDFTNRKKKIMTNQTQTLEVSHQYPWKFAKEIIPIIFLALLPIALYFFTTLISFYVFGAISLALAATLLIMGLRRKKRSRITAIVDSNNFLSVSGGVQKFDATKNRVVLKNVTQVKFEERTYHPTIRLIAGRNTLRLPKRLALQEPLNTYLNENFPSRAVVDKNAKPVLNEILKGKEVVSVEKSESIPLAEKKPAVTEARQTVVPEKVSENKNSETTTTRIPVQESNYLNATSFVEGSNHIAISVNHTDSGVEESAVTQEEVVPVKPVAGQRVQPRKKSKSKR